MPGVDCGLGAGEAVDAVDDELGAKELGRAGVELLGDPVRNCRVE